MEEKFVKKTMDELLRSSAHSHKESDTLFPIVIILENVRSMHNVGSIFRTADAFNVAQIALCGFTPKPPHREIQKTALGATESVTWRYTDNISDFISELKQSGYSIISIEQVHNSTSLNKFKFTKNMKVAFIFGNEVEGVSQETLQISDDCLEIPQFGSKHSLNIATSAGVVLWHYVNSIL